MNNEISESLKSYSSKLESSRSVFLKMIYDSFIEFDKEELENTINIINLSNEEKSSKKQKIDKQKGFYSTFEQFLNGFEYEKMHGQIEKIIHKITGKDDVMDTKNDNNLEIRQMEFMKLEDIPIKPQKKMEFREEKNDSSMNFKNKKQQTLPTFHFKSLDYKIVSLTSASSILPNKLGRFIKEYISNSETNHVIKLVDYQHDNKMTFVDRFFIENTNDSQDPTLTGNIDFRNLDIRSDILVQSRFTFIEKIATTICKFIITLKKFYKNKKDNEKNQNFSLNNTNLKTNNKINSNEIEHRASNMQTNNKNDKLVKIREIISMQVLNNLIKNGLKQKGDVDMKRFRKIYNRKLEEKQQKNKDEKVKKLKEKLNTMIYKIKRPEYVVSSGEEQENQQNNTSNEQEQVYDSESNLTLPQGQDQQSDRKNTVDSSKKLDDIAKNRKKSIIHYSQLYDVVNENDEKVIVPKKKVNFVGLKMFIKEELNKMTKK